MGAAKCTAFLSMNEVLGKTDIARFQDMKFVKAVMLALVRTEYTGRLFVTTSVMEIEPKIGPCLWYR